MRAPMAKGLGAMSTPRASRAAKVSRALCPGAIITTSAGTTSCALMTTPDTAPLSMQKSVACARKRTSPPRAIIVCRMALTTERSMSVPTCGLELKRMFSGAPAATRSDRTLRQRGSLMFVVSLPSEKVPAPPSPNCTLEFGSKSPCSQKWCTFAARLSTSSPRSSNRGRKPSSDSSRPAKRPAGPVPIITGRYLRLCSPSLGKQ